MSTAFERSALDHPISLFEIAQRLHELHPDEPLPNEAVRSAFPVRVARQVRIKERRASLEAAVRDYLDDHALTTADMHWRCAELEVTSLDVQSETFSALASDPSPRLLGAARWLIRQGTCHQAVLVGLGLLSGHAEHADIDLVKTVGLLPFLDSLALKVLVGIPGTERDLMWFADRSRGHVRTEAVEALAGNQDPSVRAWVLATPKSLLSSSLARRLAEHYDLSQLLGEENISNAAWDGAGSLLLAMTSTENYAYEITRYRHAPVVYRRWVEAASGRHPELERATMLAAVSQDLATGPAAVAVEDRWDLVRQIRDVLTTSAWHEMLENHARSDDLVASRRAAWAIQEATRDEECRKGFAVRVVVPDSTPDGRFASVETRILIDGIPVIAATFDKGPAADPAYLLQRGALRATEDPHDVRLAEAYCTEGCCGALYVTIVREGDEVVWTRRRSSRKGASSLPDIRFDAVVYDHEIERAAQDFSWEWPARTVARLVGDALHADPSILSRWDCSLGWCGAWLRDLDAMRLWFNYPYLPPGTRYRDDSHVQLGLVIDVLEDKDAKITAASIVESLRTTDPKETAEVIGGAKDGAEKLGISRRGSVRWDARNRRA